MYGYSGKPDDTLKLVRSKRKKTRPEQHSIEIDVLVVINTMD